VELAILAVLAFGTVADAQTPVPIAERTTTRYGRTTRVSLFSNHVAVVTIRSETEDFYHRATLDFDEYMVYLQAIQRSVETLSDEPVTSDVTSGDSTTTLVIHVGLPSPRTLHYSPLASLNLSAGKIAGIMDDIETRVLATLPGEDTLRRWDPVIGQCVVLRHGGEACVAAVAEDGTIVLVQDESGVTITVASENRAEVIASVLETEP
jgi:hypothetical protein